MDKIQIRAATKNDFLDVYPLFEQLWPKKILNEVELEKVFNRGIDSCSDELLCAITGGKVIGFCAYAVVNNLWQEGYISYIYALVVDEQYHGAGIGTLLMQSVIQQSKTHGYKRVELDSGFPREQAHKFYEKLGFEKRAFLFSLSL